MFSKAALLSLALPAAYGAVHESLAALPNGWSASTKAVEDSDVMTLQVALQYRNLHSLESRLRDVSDPRSANYGKYLELEEMNSIFSPSDKDARRVKSWLQKSGAKNIVNHGGLVSFTTTVGEANKMLDTKFAYYTNGQVTNLQTTQYSIPDSLTDAIDLVSPTVYFSGHKKGVSPITTSVTKRSDEQIDAATKACTYPFKGIPDGYLLTPECIQELYSTSGYKPDVSSGSNVAFGSFLGESASHSDLAEFEKNLKLPAHQFEILKLINGGVNDQNPKTEMDGEADLDVENLAGLVGELPIGEYITGGVAPFHPDLLSPNKSSDQNEPYLQYYTYLLAQPSKDIPWVITNSYGDDENTVPYKYATRVCSMIGMMGMRGKTIFESSGDTGTGAPCRSNNGSNAVQFTPQFPGTCPYVTGVGGTQAFPKEKAWKGSSGGFSNYFAPAWYQKEAIETYLSKYLPKSVYHYYSSNQYVNFTGRGFPDVSAHSATPYYYNVINGTIVGNGGTSAASPVVAGVFTLLNDVRFRAGKPSLGFINPLIYSGSYEKGFNDITTGGSIGCNGVDFQNGEKIPGGGIIPYASWNATPGWDPVTGLGTPNFSQLKTIVLGNSYQQ